MEIERKKRIREREWKRKEGCEREMETMSKKTTTRAREKQTKHKYTNISMERKTRNGKYVQEMGFTAPIFFLVYGQVNCSAATDCFSRLLPNIFYHFYHALLYIRFSFVSSDCCWWVGVGAGGDSCGDGSDGGGLSFLG